MQYKHAVLKTINNRLVVEVNENEKPNDESMFYKRKSEDMNWGDYLLKEWLQSCKYLDFASEEDKVKIMHFLKYPSIERANNINISSIITIKDDLVYFKGNEESQIALWHQLDEIYNESTFAQLMEKFTITLK